MSGEAVYRGHSAALSGKGGVESDGEEAPFRQRLGVEAGALLLHRPEGAADGHGGQSALGVLGRVLVRRQSNPVAVDKGDLFVVYTVAFWKRLVPILGQLKFCRFQHG